MRLPTPSTSLTTPLTLLTLITLSALAIPNSPPPPSSMGIVAREAIAVRLRYLLYIFFLKKMISLNYILVYFGVVC